MDNSLADNLKEITIILQSMDCDCWIDEANTMGVLKSDFLDIRAVTDLFYRLMEAGFQIRHTHGNLEDYFVIEVGKKGSIIPISFFYDFGNKLAKGIWHIDGVDIIHFEKSDILPLLKVDYLFYPQSYGRAH